MASGGASPSKNPSTGIPWDDKPLPVKGDLVSTRDSLLEGFVISDDPERIQENLYVILGHGNLQRHVLLCGTLSFFVMLLNTLEYKLIGHFVDHWCRPPEELRHLNATAWKNMAIPVEPNGNFSRCNVYDPPVQDGSDEERHQVPCGAWDYDTDRPEDSIVSRWDLVCDHGWLYLLSSVTYMLGAVLFTPVAGYLADRVGRRPIVKIAMSTLLVASMGACVADTFLLFLLTRFTVSGSAHSIVMVLYILLYEVTGSERRTRFGIIDTAIAFTLVPRIVNGLSRLTPRWSLVQAAVLLPTGVLAFWCYLLDESPAWLLATWNIAEAERCLMVAAKRNGLDLSRAKNSYRQLREQLLKQEMGVVQPGKASGLIFDGPVHAAFLFQIRVVCVALSWFTLTMVFYAFTLPPASDADNIVEIAQLVLQVIITTTAASIMAIFFEIFEAYLITYLQVFCYACVCWYVDLRGHRSALSLALISLGISMVFEATLLYSTGGRAARAFGVAVQCACYCAVSLNYGYAAEIYPTQARSIGLSWSFVIGRVGALAATALPIVSGAEAQLAVNLVMVLLVALTAIAIQWLPDVLVVRKPNNVPESLGGTLAPEGRKELLKASLTPQPPRCSGKKHRRRRRRGAKEASQPVDSPSPSPWSSPSPSGQSSPRRSSTATPANYVS